MPLCSSLPRPLAEVNVVLEVSKGQSPLLTTNFDSHN